MSTETIFSDGLHLRPLWTLHDFYDPNDEIASLSRLGASMRVLEAQFRARLARRFWFPGNLPLNEGINAFWTLFCGGAETAFSNANAYVGAGDSNTAENATQAGLQATTNKLYKAMDATFPTYGSSQKMTARSTFGASEANFTWNEITLANGNSDSAKNLNRKVQSMGLKSSPYARIATLEVTGS